MNQLRLFPFTVDVLSSTPPPLFRPPNLDHVRTSWPGMLDLFVLRWTQFDPVGPAWLNLVESSLTQSIRTQFHMICINFLFVLSYNFWHLYLFGQILMNCPFIPKSPLFVKIVHSIESSQLFSCLPKMYTSVIAHLFDYSFSIILSLTLGWT